jgi:hypothetical protein
MKSSWMYLIFAAFAVLLVGIVFSNTFMHAALAAFNQTNTNDNSTSLSSSDPKPKSANATTPVTNTTTTTTKTLSTAKDNNLTTSTTSSSSTAALKATDPAKKVPHVIVFNLDKISVNAAKAPTAPVSNATCGQEAGFPIQLNVNGLAPDTTVMWRLVHSNGAKTQGPWGTFETNSTGGFSEPTYMEDLPKDKYHLLFFNSVQDDNFRPSDAVASALVTVASSNSCTP